MAKTLLQHWLVNYFCFQFEQYSSTVTPQQTVCDDYKEKIRQLLKVNYKNDEYFLAKIHHELKELVDRESDLSIENNRGNSLGELLKHLKWLVSPTVAHSLLGGDFGVSKVFKLLDICDADISDYLVENKAVKSSSLPRFGILVVKRNIAEYLINKLFYSKYRPDSYEVFKELPEGQSDALLKTNIQIVTRLALDLTRQEKELKNNPIDEGSGIGRWNTELNTSLTAYVKELNKSREEIFATRVKDYVVSTCYSLLGKEGDIAKTASMESLSWVIDNLLSEGMDIKAGININMVMSKCFTELKQRPEVFKLAVNDDEKYAGTHVHRPVTSLRTSAVAAPKDDDLDLISDIQASHGK